MRRLALTAIPLLFAPAAMVAQATPPFGIAPGTFIAIVSRDVAAQSTWYQRIFGLREANRMVAEDGQYDIRVLEGPGLLLELLQLREATAPPERPFGLFKAGMYVRDIDAAFAWLRANEVEIVGRIVTDPALGIRNVVFRDPEGNRLQFFQPPGG